MRYPRKEMAMDISISYPENSIVCYFFWGYISSDARYVVGSGGRLSCKGTLENTGKLSPLRIYLFLMFLGGAYSRMAYTRGLMESSETCHIKIHFQYIVLFIL